MSLPRKSWADFYWIFPYKIIIDLFINIYHFLYPKEHK